MLRVLQKRRPPCTALRIAVGPTLVFALFLCLFPSHAHSSRDELRTVLSDAYGEEVARECSDYYGGLEIPEDRVPVIIDAVERLVKAGYPSGCPVQYLKAAADLSRAGIDLGDLTNKIREGIAKKVSPERLMRVIVQRAEALLEARVLVLNLEGQGVEFLDRQMAYSVMADYLLRGITGGTITEHVAGGDLKDYPALANLIR